MFPVRYEHHIHINNKSIPLTGRGDPHGLETSMIPHILDKSLSDDG
jgi:hypothetical protein